MSQKISFVTVLVVILGVTLMLHVVPLDENGAWIRRAILDALHLVGFLALSVFVLLYFRARSEAFGLNSVQCYLLTLGIVGCFAVLSEGAQLMTSRNASWGDIVRDIVGISSGLLIASGFLSNSRWRYVLLAVAIIAVGLGIQRPLGVILAGTISQRETAIISFDNLLDGYRVEGLSADLEIVTASEHLPTNDKVLRVRPNGQGSSEGVALHGLTRDWSKFRALKFSAAAAESDITELDLRLTSSATQKKRAGGVRITIFISTAPTDIVLSIEEIANAPPRRPAHLGPLDLANISGVSVLYKTRTRTAIYLNDVRLD
jgi:hypothetical protein